MYYLNAIGFGIFLGGLFIYIYGRLEKKKEYVDFGFALELIGFGLQISGLLATL